MNDALKIVAGVLGMIALVLLAWAALFLGWLPGLSR